MITAVFFTYSMASYGSVVWWGCYCLSLGLSFGLWSYLLVLGLSLLLSLFYIKFFKGYVDIRYLMIMQPKLIIIRARLIIMRRRLIIMERRLIIMWPRLIVIRAKLIIMRRKLIIIQARLCYDNKYLKLFHLSKRNHYFAWLYKF